MSAVNSVPVTVSHPGASDLDVHTSFSKQDLSLCSKHTHTEEHTWLKNVGTELLFY